METTKFEADATTIQHLKNIIENDPNSLNASVANEAMNYHNPNVFFSDILQHGCQSGMVSSLIYYTDTHKFFDKHYDVIEKIRNEVEDNLGEPLSISGDLKNCLSWFTFEETAYRIALDLGLIM